MYCIESKNNFGHQNRRKNATGREYSRGRGFIGIFFFWGNSMRDEEKSREQLILELITLRKKLIDDKLELNQYRKEVTRLDRLETIGQMAAAISHEVRNPLTVVKGFLQMFTTKTKYLEENEYLQLMISELDRANSIITNFLSVSRTKKLKLEKLNLNQIIDYIYPLIYADALKGEKDILLDLNPIPDSFFDKEEIKQLVLNLARNGLEAMAAGGCLTISTVVRDNNVVLSIKDQGCGLSQDVLEHMGTPFLTTKENGTGLGLAVCYGIVSKYGGNIDVETSSKGTTFHVKFPTKNNDGNILSN